jgi:hypothetical protein
MHDLTCTCGVVHRGVTVWPVRCRCGRKIAADGNETQSKPVPILGKYQRLASVWPSLPCISRGDVIGVADCDCATKPKVYQCNLHGKPCMDRTFVDGPMVVNKPDGTWITASPLSCSKCSDAIRGAKVQPVDNAAIITTHWNPAGFSRLNETLSRWLDSVSGTIVARADGCDALWQKERLINREIERLPGGIRYVCWCDHDIIFDDAEWLAKACNLIESGVDCVQPFTNIEYLDRRGRVERKSKGAASVALAGGNPDTGPGAVWVASREWLATIGGLYDRNIVGGGDAVLFEAISGQRTRYRERQSPRSRDHLDRWIESVGPVRYACLPGTIRHLWHGDFANRQYVSRDAIMRQYDYDPDQHITIDSRGLLAWTDAAPQAMRNAVAAYFAGRKEDG